MDCCQWSSLGLDCKHWGQSCELWTEFDHQRPAWRQYIFPPGRDLWTSIEGDLRRCASWGCTSLPLLQFNWSVWWGKESDFMNVRQKNQNGNKVRFSGSGGNCGVLATSEFVFVKQYLKCREMLSCSHHIKFKNKLVIIFQCNDFILFVMKNFLHRKFRHLQISLLHSFVSFLVFIIF